MQSFSIEKTGFAALTIVEFLLQEMVIKGVLSEVEVKRVLRGAAERHEQAAEGAAEKIEMNMEAALLIRTLMSGLQPLFERKPTSKKKRRTSKRKPLKASKEPKRKPTRSVEDISQ